MSYRDPYSEQQATVSHGRYQDIQQPHFTQPSQDHAASYLQQTDGDMGGPSYNPYDSTTRYKDEQQDAQDSYGRSGYTYGAYEGAYNYPPVQRRPTQMTTSSKKSKPSMTVVPVRRSGFEEGEFPPAVPHFRKGRTPKTLREYRYDHQGNLWMKGGKRRCAGRVCCCTLMTTVFLIVSIVLALALWVRPPTITIGSVQTMDGANGTSIQEEADGISIDLGVNISVQNPNYFSVDFKKIEAQIFYPIDNTPVGGGTANNIEFRSLSTTNFTFPFTLTYNSTDDPQSQIILDLANKCGVVSGTTKSDISVNYKITLGIRILLITISPVISNQFTFPCPLQASDISKFLGSSTT